MSEHEHKEAREMSLISSTADPSALGLGGFALTTFVLSMVNAGFLNKAGEPIVLGVAFFYGGLAQLLAGQQEYKKNNVFGATAFNTYGAFWMSLAFFILMSVLGVFKVPADVVGPAKGVFLAGFTIFNTYMMFGSFKTNVAVALVFVFLEITFILLALADFGVMTTTLGGIFGLITAAVAWYASAAVVLNTVYKKVVLPVGPLS